MSACGEGCAPFKHPAPADDDSDGSDIMDPQTLLKTHVSQPLTINAAQAKTLEWLKGQATAHPPTRIPDDDYDGIELRLAADGGAHDDTSQDVREPFHHCISSH